MSKRRTNNKTNFFDYSLDKIKEEENFIRDNLYKNEYSDHKMNKEPFYDLIRIDEKIWFEICSRILNIKKDNSLYFSNSVMNMRKYVTRSWSEIEEIAKNNDIKKYFGDNSENIYIAGGSALSVLFDYKSKDVDFFTIKELLPNEIKVDNYKITEGAINFGKNNQLIKRLYKTPHEIIHSFDIDCCCVMLNEKGYIYGTKRFIYSLTHGYNTVDFNYFSPSYEWRLIKYATRGFSIKIPNVINCENDTSLYEDTAEGVCFPDSIWKIAEIRDILQGSMLKSLLMNAEGIEKILITSAIASSNKGENTVRSMLNLELSDYEVDTTKGDKLKGLLNTSVGQFYISGSLGHDKEGKVNSYNGKLKLINQNDSEDYLNNLCGDKEDIRDVQEFSLEFHTILFNIIFSEYRYIKPGGQATSTYHQIVLEDPDVWFTIDKLDLLNKSLRTLLYFKNVNRAPNLYDEKIYFFADIEEYDQNNDPTKLFSYHLARLFLNNKIYNNFNDITVNSIKINLGDTRVYSLTYNKKEYIVENNNISGILKAIEEINSKYKILQDEDYQLLKALKIRSQENENAPNFNRRYTKSYPKIEIRQSI